MDGIKIAKPIRVVRKTFKQWMLQACKNLGAERPMNWID